MIITKYDLFTGVVDVSLGVIITIGGQAPRMVASNIAAAGTSYLLTATAGVESEILYLQFIQFKEEHYW